MGIDGIQIPGAFEGSPEPTDMVSARWILGACNHISCIVLPCPAATSFSGSRAPVVSVSLETTAKSTNRTGDAAANYFQDLSRSPRVQPVFLHPIDRYRRELSLSLCLGSSHRFSLANVTRIGCSFFP